MGTWHKDMGIAIAAAIRRHVGKDLNVHLWRICNVRADGNEHDIRYLIGKKVPENIAELVAAGYARCRNMDDACIRNLAGWEKEHPYNDIE